jgi:hypothetical protein
VGLDITGVDLNAELNGRTFLRETLPRLSFSGLSDKSAALTTQVMSSYAVWLEAGDVITNIAFRSGATAAGTPTNWWFALYDNSTTPALIGQTADQTSTAWAANTTKSLPLSVMAAGFSAPFKVLTSGVYYVACMVKATTVPSLVCQDLFDAGFSTGLITGQKTLAQTSGSALTATAPTTIATPTAVANRAYAVLN